MAEKEHATSVDPQLRQRLGSLYSYMAPRLGIQAPPRIVFTQDAKNAEKPFGHTAYYDHQLRLIRVYTTKRHPTDILRSFAHELIHHWQNEHGALPMGEHDPNHYAQKNPTLRQREEEAYLFGNMMFRDWQDQNRYGVISENRDPVKAAIKKALFEVMKHRAIYIPETITPSEIKQLIRERIANYFERYE